jgi:nucleoside-diphosphate kinase
VHASDSPESGRREVALFFQPDEIIDWKRDSEAWVYE